MPIVAKYLEMADKLKKSAGLYTLHHLEPIIADKEKLKMNTIADRNIRDRLLQVKYEPNLLITPLPFETTLNFHRLQEYADLFDEGDKSEINRAAITILRLLGKERKVENKSSQRGSGSLEQLLYLVESKKEVPAENPQLEVFEKLSLEQQIEAINEEAIVRERGLKYEKKKIIVRSALETTVAERERLGVKIFALGKLDEEGRFFFFVSTSEYLLYLLYPGNNGFDSVDTYRSEIPKNNHTEKDLAYWDNKIQAEPDVKIWEEWNVCSYNRQIQELSVIEKEILNLQKFPSDRVKRDRRQYLVDRKLVMLSSLFELAEELVPNFSDDQYLYHWRKGRSVTFDLHPIKDSKIIPILLLETEEWDLSISEKKVKAVLDYSDLVQKKKAYVAGDESDSAVSAVEICQMLEI